MIGGCSIWGVSKGFARVSSKKRERSEFGCVVIVIHSLYIFALCTYGELVSHIASCHDIVLIRHSSSFFLVNKSLA